MERDNRLKIIVTNLMLPWLLLLPCCAQPSAQLAATLPPTSSSTLPSAPSTERGVPPELPDQSPPQTQIPAPPVSSVAPTGEVKLKPPPLETGDIPLPINLATALRLADARPLVIAAAQASSWVAEAQLQHAKLLWVPELDLSACYYRHDGVGPDFNRGATVPFSYSSTRLPINQNINWFYSGAGLYEVVSLTDAIFEPLAARQVLKSRQWDIQTAKNNALFDTAKAYFRVHQYRGMYAGTLDAVDRGRKLIERIDELSKDMVPRIEVERARRLLADLEQHAASARENWRVASADLTQVLRLDPRAVVVPLEHDHLQITLIDPARPLDELVPVALFNRPEIASQQALVQAAQVHIRQEKLRPVIPTVLITGFQTPGGMRTQIGIFGTGADKSLNLWSVRDDISAQVVWQLDAFGLGNLARIKEQRGSESEAITELFRIQDDIVSEMTQTQANLQSAAVRVIEAERSLRKALITFDGNYEGLRQTRRFGNILRQIYRPQEVVKALEDLMVSYDQYFSTVADYNLAQFAIFHAMGYPAREIAYFRTPGNSVPTDTTRPAYMPLVGSGPPPATR